MRSVSLPEEGQHQVTIPLKVEGEENLAALVALDGIHFHHSQIRMLVTEDSEILVGSANATLLINLALNRLALSGLPANDPWLVKVLGREKAAADVPIKGLNRASHLVGIVRTYVMKRLPLQDKGADEAIQLQEFFFGDVGAGATFRKKVGVRHLRHFRDIISFHEHALPFFLTTVANIGWKA